MLNSNVFSTFKAAGLFLILCGLPTTSFGDSTTPLSDASWTTPTIQSLTKLKHEEYVGQARRILLEDSQWMLKGISPSNPADGVVHADTVIQYLKAVSAENQTRLERVVPNATQRTRCLNAYSAIVPEFRKLEEAEAVAIKALETHEQEEGTRPAARRQARRLELNIESAKKALSDRRAKFEREISLTKEQFNALVELSDLANQLNAHISGGPAHGENGPTLIGWVGLKEKMKATAK